MYSHYGGEEFFVRAPARVEDYAFPHPQIPHEPHTYTDECEDLPLVEYTPVHSMPTTPTSGSFPLSEGEPAKSFFDFAPLLQYEICLARSCMQYDVQYPLNPVVQDALDQIAERSPPRHDFAISGPPPSSWQQSDLGEAVSTHQPPIPPMGDLPGEMEALQMASPQKPKAKRRDQVPRACIHCKRVSKKCDRERPCNRCVKMSGAHAATCVDAPRLRDLKKAARKQ